MGNRLDLSCDCLSSPTSTSQLLNSRSSLNVKKVHMKELSELEEEIMSPDRLKASLISKSKNKKNISIKDFVVERPLGIGGFGKVLLVKKFSSNKLYAMKIIKKSDIFENHLEEKIVLEKSVLSKSKHPFIVDLKYAFQTPLKIYLIMEYMAGGELFQLLKKMRRFSEEYACFYLAEVLLSIEYLHKEINIAYRDLKPENILLSHSGHIKITDFGLSKKIKGKAFSMVGTIEYLAPEIILNTGHTYAVDYWSLGVLLFEMLAGYPPFYSENRNIKEIQNKIIKNSPLFPSFISEKSLDLLKKLLVSNPEERLGFEDINQIKNHSFFNGINWDNLLSLKIDPPFKLSKYTLERMNANMKEKTLLETFNSGNPVFPEIPGISYDYEKSCNDFESKDKLKTKENILES